MVQVNSAMHWADWQVEQWWTLLQTEVMMEATASDVDGLAQSLAAGCQPCLRLPGTQHLITWLARAADFAGEPQREGATCFSS